MNTRLTMQAHSLIVNLYKISGCLIYCYLTMISYLT